MSKISTVVAADTPALVSIINNAYRGPASKKGWTTEADLLDGLRVDEETLSAMLKTPGAVILKCSSDSNEIEGCVYLEQQGDKLYLGLLTVSPEIQVKGIGKVLLQAAVEYAKQLQLKSICMTVISVRTELIAWYERQGYQKTGETKPFPADNKLVIPKQPLELLVMEKLL